MDKEREKRIKGKEYLKYIRSLGTRLRIKEERIAQLKSDICSLQALNYEKDKITGGNLIDISDKIAKLDEIIRATNKEWNELIEERERAQNTINQIGNALEQRLITSRYIAAKSWEQIAFELGLSWAQTFRVHRLAVKSFIEIFKLDTK